jgi:hypothetical protein
MEQELSPIEKARSLKEKADFIDSENKQTQKAQKRAKLKEFLDEQIKIHEEEMGGVNSLKEGVQKSEAVIKEEKEKRISKKKEGKEVANILRDEQGRLKVKANEEMREIFAPIIKTLHDINEQVKIEQELKNRVSKELKEKQKSEYERAFNALRKFREEHPELIDINKTKEQNEKDREWREKLAKKLDTLKEQFTPYLKNKVGYEDRRSNLIDITGIKRMEELDKLIETESNLADSKQKALDKELDDYRSKGKGFFQSQKSFNEAYEKKKEEKEKQKNIIWSEYSKLWDEKTQLQKHLYDLDRNYDFREMFGKFTDDFKNYINQEGVTFADLFEEAKKRNQKYIDGLVLGDEEMLLKEIEDTLEKNETLASKSRFS